MRLETDVRKRGTQYPTMAARRDAVTARTTVKPEERSSRSPTDKRLAGSGETKSITITMASRSLVLRRSSIFSLRCCERPFSEASLSIPWPDSVRGSGRKEAVELQDETAEGAEATEHRPSR